MNALGLYKESSLTARADFAREIMQLIDNDTVSEFYVLSQIEKLAQKAIRKETRYWDKVFKAFKKGR